MRPTVVQQRRGITLMEVMTVILILGISAAVALPSFSNAVSRVRADSAAAQMAADLNYLRQQAIVRSGSVTIVFDESALTYGSDDVVLPERPGERFHIDLSEQLTGGSLDVANELEGGVTYDQWGMPSASGSLVIRQSSSEATVVIDSETGNASVLEE